jgi:hypothetical protein
VRVAAATTLCTIDAASDCDVIFRDDSDRVNRVHATRSMGGRQSESPASARPIAMMIARGMDKRRAHTSMRAAIGRERFRDPVTSITLYSRDARVYML